MSHTVGGRGCHASLTSDLPEVPEGERAEADAGLSGRTPTRCAAAPDTGHSADTLRRLWLFTLGILVVTRSSWA